MKSLKKIISKDKISRKRSKKIENSKEVFTANNSKGEDFTWTYSRYNLRESQTNCRESYVVC